ncbi:poly polymerase catalytic domain-containing protein [Aspergillus crustosus]
MSMATNPFETLVISVTGRFGHIKQGDLQQIIETLGATFTEKVTSTCTHLIATDHAMETRSTKVKQAYQVYRCEIVYVDWLFDSERSGRPMQVDKYTISIRETGDRRHNEDEGGQHANAPMEVGYSPDLVIPAHPTCPWRYEFSIALDCYGHPWDAKLHLTSAERQKNDFYYLQLLVNKTKTKFVCWSTCGRMGDNGRPSRLDPCDEATARAQFEMKFLERAGYAWASRFDYGHRQGMHSYQKPSYVTRDEKDPPFDVNSRDNIRYIISIPVSTVSLAVKGLMALVLNDYTLLKELPKTSEFDKLVFPQGGLSLATIQKGRGIITKLAEFIKSPVKAAQKYQSPMGVAMDELSQQYFMLIPHAFGANPRPTIEFEQDVKKERDLLDALEGAVTTNQMILSGRQGYVDEVDQAAYNLKLVGVSQIMKSAEYTAITNYYHLMVQGTASEQYQLVRIFRFRRRWEEQRFTGSRFAHLPTSNRWLLWHGSRLTNFASILSNGLQIRPQGVKLQGQALGKGVYFSDSAALSLRYTYIDGGYDDGLLLLCDVELGDRVNNTGTPPTKHDGAVTATQRGSGGGFTQDASVIKKDLKGARIPAPQLGTQCEYVVYDPAQVRIRYLLHIKAHRLDVPS